MIARFSSLRTRLVRECVLEAANARGVSDKAQAEDVGELRAELNTSIVVLSTRVWSPAAAGWVAFVRLLT